MLLVFETPVQARAADRIQPKKIQALNDYRLAPVGSAMCCSRY